MRFDAAIASAAMLRASIDVDAFDMFARGKSVMRQRAVITLPARCYSAPLLAFVMRKIALIDGRQDVCRAQD